MPAFIAFVLKHWRVFAILGLVLTTLGFLEYVHAQGERLGKEKCKAAYEKVIEEHNKAALERIKETEKKYAPTKKKIKEGDRSIYTGPMVSLAIDSL